MYVMLVIVEKPKQIAVVWHQKGEEFDRVVISAEFTFSHW